MTMTERKVIKAKVGLLELAERGAAVALQIDTDHLALLGQHG